MNVAIEEETDFNNQDEQDVPRSSYSALDLLSREQKEMPTLLHPILPKKGLVGLAGGSDVGKSALLRQFVLYLVAGMEYFLGWKFQPEHFRALYVATEDSDESISYLLKKQVSGMFSDYSRFSGLDFLFEWEEGLLEAIENKLKNQLYDVIIIDAFLDVFDGQLNQNNQVRSFLNKFSQLSHKYNCLFIFLHHSGKKTEFGEPSKHNLIGSQAFEAKMRVVLELREDWDDPDIRHLCIVKANYLPKQYKTDSYVLRFDDNMLFHHEGDRKPFEALIKPVEKENKANKIDMAVELAKEGKSYDEIAEVLGVAKSTISRWIKSKLENVQ